MFLHKICSINNLSRSLLRALSLSILLIIVVNLIDVFDKISFPLNSSKIECDKNSFWKSPWGSSKIHKGIDYFDNLGVEVISPVNGIVLRSGFGRNGGNYLYIISTNLKIYYFAHLHIRYCRTGDFVRKGLKVGLVGDSGNARFSPFHLHFSIFSCIPILRYYDSTEISGWQKMFYLNPANYIAK